MNRTRLLLLLLSAAAFAQADLAQAQGTVGVVEGTVKNSAGVPLPRANVVLQGTRVGARTGTDGHYVIRVAPGSYTLRVSLIGFSPSTRPVAVAEGQSLTADFQLEVLPTELQPVVSTGYRVQSRAAVTGSISSVSSEDFKDVPTDNLSNELAGRLSGVTITQNAGTPGRESSILVRAVGTFNNADPLYVIDGVVSDKFAFDGLNTQDVESISVLKDGAAGSVYGSRAANGVILVTTNRGRVGAPSFSYSGSLGTQRATRIPRALNAYQQAKAINDAWQYNNIPASDPRYYSSDELDYFKTHNFNWLDDMWRNPVSTQHAVNIQGGSSAVRYFLGGSLLKESGSFDNIPYRRFTSRGNLDVDITSRLKASVDFNTTGRNRLGPSWAGGDQTYEDLYKALNLRSSMVPPYVNGLPTGNWVEWHPGVVIEDQQGYLRRDWSAFNTRLRLDYQMPFLDGLKSTVSYYKNLGESHLKQFNLPYQMALFNTLGANNHIVGDSLVGWRDRSQAEYLLNQEGRDDDYQANVQLSYQHAFGAHSLDGLLVYEQAASDTTWFSGRRDTFISPLIDQFVGGSADQAQANGGQFQTARISYVGSLAYDYAEKYFLQTNARYDGSVIFAPQNRWGFFPSVSAGWRISQEPFFKLGFIDELKLRASYGMLGNDNVGSFQWLQSYVIQPGAVFGAPTIGLTPGDLANPNITWEKSKTYDGGLDARFWHDRMTFTADLFRRNTYDILGSRQSSIPDTFGASLPDENYEAVNTHGYELELGYDNGGRTAAKSFRYYARGNFSYATNKILRLNEAQNLRPYQSRIGRTTAPSSDCFGYVATGILRTQADIDALPAGYTINGVAPKLGMLNYADLRGPTTDDPDGKITSDDQQWICKYSTDGHGHLAPPTTFGLAFGGSWMHLRIDGLIQGAAGNKVMMTTNGRDLQARAEESSYAYWADSWTPDNPNGAYPGWRATSYRTRYPASTFWLRDDSFVRLKTVTVSYDLPARVASLLGSRDARLYVSGQNLALLYDKIGDWNFDPEMDDIRAYPLMRTVSVGMNFSVNRRTEQ